MLQLINLSWILPLVGVAAIYFVPGNIKSTLARFAVLTNAMLTSWIAVSVLIGQVISFTFSGGNIFGDVLIRVDQLSAWFILIINFTTITGVFYGSGYLKAYVNTSGKLAAHWILYVLFQMSMVWVCMVQHGLLFLIVWEIMSLSSMMLVIFDYNKPGTIKAGINYLVQMHISVIFLTMGFIWVYFETGSFSFDAFTTYFGSNSNSWLFLLFFVGFGLKAGFIPLHSWLPLAHPAAPSHISGVMSGVIVKLGIYGIFRVVTYLQSDYLLLGGIVVVVSVLSGLYGILNAAMQRDFKKMLAYCTIENIGIIGVGIGVGLIGLGNQAPMLYYLGFGGALLHVLNHSLFKSLLFFSAGSVFQQTHTRDIEKLGGLIKSMPQTAVFFLIGAIAIGGLPPFNGFVSEFLIYSGLIEGIKLQNMSEIILMVLTIAGMSVIGGLSIMTFTKTFGVTFLGTPRQTLKHPPQEVSLLMRLPQYVIVAAMLSVAVFPQFYLLVINRILAGLTVSVAVAQPVAYADYISIMQSISIYSLLLIAIILFFWGVRYLALKGKSQVIGTTWGCGYTAATSKMQYTGKSFTKSLGKIFSFIVIERKQFEELATHEVFPKTKRYTSHYHDFFDFRVIRFVINRLIYSANYFRFIQNGRIQSYVLYGIVFILTIFLLTVFNVLL